MTRSLRTAASILALALVSAWTLPARAGHESLAELSLEELMELNFNTMGITGIHHTHSAGEWMIGYTAMFMRMDGNLDGTRSVSSSEVLADYMVSPTSMDMRMHMLHLMHAPTRWLTLMVMAPYVVKSMEHVTRTGERFKTRSQGFGDLELSGLFSLLRGEEHRLVFSGGLRVPTGSIDERDDTPMGHVRLPYPMQIGSGSVELVPGLTYLGQRENLAWGGRAAGTVRLYENSNDYRLGEEVELTAWGAYKLTSWASGSLRLRGRGWGNIHGADPQLDPALVPTADPDRRAGRRLDLLFGVNLFKSVGWLAGNRIAVEGGLPVYQWLDGPQLETDWMLTLAWDWTF
jgi:hypothetical protein